MTSDERCALCGEEAPMRCIICLQPLCSKCRCNKLRCYRAWLAWNGKKSAR